MIKFNGIIKTENKIQAKIQLGTREFVGDLSMQNRKATFTITFDKPMEFMYLSHAVSTAYDKYVDIEWSRYRKDISFNADFPWDAESKRKVREACVEISNARFKELVKDTGLLAVYKRYKKQGAKLVAADAVRNQRWNSDIYVLLHNGERVMYDNKDKKLALADKHFRRSRRGRREITKRIMSADSDAKLIKKIDKYYLNQFLGITKDHTKVEKA